MSMFGEGGSYGDGYGGKALTKYRKSSGKKKATRRPNIQGYLKKHGKPHPTAMSQVLGGKTRRVKGYTKADGTKVRGYTRHK